MPRATGITLRTSALAALVGAALLVAGCGSSSSPSTTTTSAPASTPSTASSTTTSASTAAGGSAGVKISTAKGSAGTFLISSGRALYLWVADTGDKSVCNGACAQAWPPLLTKGTPT